MSQKSELTPRGMRVDISVHEDLLAQRPSFALAAATHQASDEIARFLIENQLFRHRSEPKPHRRAVDHIFELDFFTSGQVEKLKQDAAQFKGERDRAVRALEDLQKRLQRTRSALEGLGLVG